MSSDRTVLPSKEKVIFQGAYPRPLASPTNIRLGWKGLPGTNTLAYYENPNVMVVKSFMVHAPGLYSINFLFVYYDDVHKTSVKM
jgi:hypothetical protein